MDKQRPQRDLARRLSLGSASQESFDCSGGLSKSGEEDLEELVGKSENPRQSTFLNARTATGQRKKIGCEIFARSSSESSKSSSFRFTSP